MLKPNSAFALLGVMVMAMLILLTSCAAPADDKTKKKDPTVAMVANKIDQYTKMGDKVADGQYILVTLQIKNLSNKTVTVKASDLSIEPITDVVEEQYSQAPEKGMTLALTKMMGMGVREKIFDYMDTSVNPRLQVERYVVFMLPKDAHLEKYRISYKPAASGGLMGPAPEVEKVSVDLVSADTVVTDHRELF
jgi:hypothetical protein